MPLKEGETLERQQVPVTPEETIFTLKETLKIAESMVSHYQPLQLPDISDNLTNEERIKKIRYRDALQEHLASPKGQRESHHKRKMVAREQLHAVVLRLLIEDLGKRENLSSLVESQTSQVEDYAALSPVDQKYIVRDVLSDLTESLTPEGIRHHLTVIAERLAREREEIEEITSL